MFRTLNHGQACLAACPCFSICTFISFYSLYVDLKSFHVKKILLDPDFGKLVEASQKEAWEELMLSKLKPYAWGKDSKWPKDDKLGWRPSQTCTEETYKNEVHLFWKKKVVLQKNHFLSN